MFVGIGYDSHRFGGPGPVKLGGVEIAHDSGLLGHSDADAALHALCDALFGAAGLGDIGSHFPDTDERFRGADSRDLLSETVRLLREKGLAPINVDLTIIAESPKIAPHVDGMKSVIAGLTGLPVERVGVKATTNEGMGFVGRGEGIAVLAAASLRPAGD